MASSLFLVMFVGLPLLMTAVQIVSTRSGSRKEPQHDPLPRCSLRDFKARDDD